MRCWLAERVDRPLADDSPVQESAGSRQRLCEAAPQGEGNVWPAAPCCPWDDFNDAKVTCRCRMASVFIANRLKSSSLLHDERISGSCQRHLPIVMRRAATFVGHRKINPGRQGAKAPNQREKIKLQIQNDMIHYETFQIPTYSLGYLINADPTGLTDLEIELIDGFLDENFPQGCTVDIDTCIDPYFSSSPAFGLPCEVYDLVLYSN